MDNFCFKSDVSTDFRSVTPFKGEIAKNAGHLITASVSSFTVTTSKKKNLTMNHQMALPGLSWCVPILVVLITKCYTSGMFLLLLFCFRTLMKLCLRIVNEAIIDWRYFMTPEIEITQRLNWQNYCSFQFTQFSSYFFDAKNTLWFSFVLASECYNILCPWNHCTLRKSF